MYIPIYRKWWFWVGVGVLCVGTFVWKWQVVMTPAEEENQIRNTVQQAYYDIMTKRGEDMVTKQKADTYGGETPEETLRLFVEALEKKDYELASKYYVVEDQEKELAELSKISEKNIGTYLNILRYKKEVKTFVNGDEATIDFYLKNEQVHFEHLVLNSYTKKWKLTDN